MTASAMGRFLPGTPMPKKSFTPGSGKKKPASKFSSPKAWSPAGHGRPVRPDWDGRPGGKSGGPKEKSARQPNTPPAPEPTHIPDITFAELGLSEATLKAISDLGFETPTPIQGMAIPKLLTGCDFVGLAQTGTGKTAAFGLPLIERIDPALSVPQALILAPTRELAVQVAKGLHDFSRQSGLKVVPVYGGQPIDRQMRALRFGAHIVVGTPGRVLDHLRRGSLQLGSIKVCVLDEADEMMALGFTEDMEAILGELPEERQLVFFSATMAPRVRIIAEKFLRNPVRVEIVARQRTLETTNQTYYEVPSGKKEEALARVLDMETPGSTIVFCRTRQETASLSEALQLRGYSAEPIHGDMGQTERERVLRRFREGQADLLIATDVAARGLDIDSVTHVINYDVPYDVEQYIHRIGRTGRAGRSGDAITLVYHRERRQLANIERLIGSKIEPARIPSPGDIARRRRESFMESVAAVLESGSHLDMEGAAIALAEEFDPVDVAAAALHLLWKERHQESSSLDPEEAYAGQEQPEAGMARLFVGMGRAEGLRPGDLVGAITNEAGLGGREIGVIEILDRSAFVEVPQAQADAVVEALMRTKLRGRSVKVEPARPAFASDSPANESGGTETPSRRWSKAPR